MAKFEGLIKKIANRNFQYEGEEFACDNCVRFRGYKLSRNLPEYTIGNQDMNLDVNYNNNTVITEIDSATVEYNLTEDEYYQFRNMLLDRVVAWR